MAHFSNIIRYGETQCKAQATLNKEIETSHGKKNRNKRIDGSLCIHMHAHTYKSTQSYMHVYMYLCVSQTKVKNLCLFFLLVRF